MFLNGRVCMITGANSGLGKATAIGLAKTGATVVMVCRSRRRGEEALSEIRAKSGNESVHLMPADLASQGAIHQLVTDFKRTYPRLDVLVNNAAVLLYKRSETEDGIETMFAVNHLAPFLLTHLLLDVLKANAPSRIVNVSSESHRGALLGRVTINFDDLQGAKRFAGGGAYSQSKLANILFTHELSKRLMGTGVTVNCLCPGMVKTNLAAHSPWYLRTLALLVRPVAKSPEQGAETSVYLASSTDVEGVSGKYYRNRKEAMSSKESYDEAVAERLWMVSAKLTKIEGAFGGGASVRPVVE